MRILLAIHNTYTDNTSGAARSIRTIVEWLASAGNECRVICTARFDAKAPDDIREHLASHGIIAEPEFPPKRLVSSGGAGRPLLGFTFNGVPVSMLLTRSQDWRAPDRDETEQFCNLCKHHLKSFEPNVLLTYGPHPAVQEVMRQAQQRGIATVFSVRNYGYEDKRWFAHASHVLTCSPFLSGYYRGKIGLESTGIVSPIDWAEVLAPEESRAFVTFVNPSLSKGAAVFARLADMLGSRRPDIPILVIQSAADAASLNSIPGIDFSKYPQIMAAPSVPRPADYFELTRILLVPSVFAEPFGRVTAEAMINGIPPIVSNRGALPETVDGAGIILPIPDWLTPETIRLPEEEEITPWYDAVCGLWDDACAYEQASAAAREAAERMYSESVLKQRYLEYFEGVLPTGEPPLTPP